MLQVQNDRSRSVICISIYYFSTRNGSINLRSPEEALAGEIANDFFHMTDIQK